MGGEGIFRFTGAFPHGRRFFSSSNLTVHSPDPFSWFYQATGRIRRGHHLSMQPVYQLALPCGRGFPGSRVSRFLSSGWGLPRNGVAVIPLGGSPIFINRFLPSALFLPVYRREAGFLQGVTLRLLLRLWQAFTRDITLFSRARGGYVTSAWSKDEVPWVQIVSFSLSSFLTAPFLTSLLAARVALRRWLPSSQEEEPFASNSPLSFRIAFLARFHFIGLPIGGTFHRNQASRVLISLLSFEASDLSGLTAQGHLEFPLTTLRRCGSRSSPSLAVWVPLRNTLLYAFPKALQAFFSKFLIFLISGYLSDVFGCFYCLFHRILQKS